MTPNTSPLMRRVPSSRTLNTLRVSLLTPIGALPPCGLLRYVSHPVRSLPLNNRVHPSAADATVGMVRRASMTATAVGRGWVMRVSFVARAYRDAPAKSHELRYRTQVRCSAPKNFRDVTAITVAGAACPLSCPPQGRHSHVVRPVRVAGVAPL